MNETVLTKPKPKTTAEYKAAFAHLIAEMNRVDERMDKDRAESERLKAETEIIKAETEIIKARASANLSRLHEQINSLSKAA